MDESRHRTLIPPDVGIRHAYPRLPLAAKTRSYIQSARPFTCLGPVIGLATAACMSVAYEYRTWTSITADWRTITDAAVALLCAQIGSNFVNLATDHAEDSINRRYRAIPRGIMSVAESATIGHILWFVAILRATIIQPAFGVLMTLIIAISYVYSAPPLRLKRWPGAGNIGIALARGLLGIVAAWSIFAPWNAAQPWTAGVILAIFILGAASSKDFADEAGDRAAGVHTLVVWLGPRRAAWASLPFALSPLLTIPVAAHLGLIRTPWTIYAIASLIILVFCWALLFRTHIENRVLEATKAWSWHYYALFALMLSFASAALDQSGAGLF